MPYNMSYACNNDADCYDGYYCSYKNNLTVKVKIEGLKMSESVANQLK